MNRKKLKFLVILIIIGIGYYIQLRTIGFSIPCIFNVITGLECPGCGMNTVAYALLQGDISRAFYANRGVVIILPVLVPFILCFTYKWLYDQEFNCDKYTWIFLIYFVCWAVARNGLCLNV
ncbi:MAG: hypothetical protein BEN18_03770 [Epulopiscium sp. Nuni2H_MBin001]|nr:MAG: hypothetical protein BEN18_03770 [Epulopiscium sp. Nuni2H_MBin001]